MQLLPDAGVCPVCGSPLSLQLDANGDLSVGCGDCGNWTSVATLPNGNPATVSPTAATEAHDIYVIALTDDTPTE